MVRHTLKSLCLVLLVLLVGTLPAQAASITWTGATLHDSDPNNNSNSWNTAANWNPAQVPAPGDAVTIAVNDSIILPGAISVASLNISTGIITGGSLTLTGAGSVWSGGQINTAIIVQSGAGLTLSGSSDHNMDGTTSSLNNQGTIVWTGGRLGTSNGYTLTNGGTFNIQADGDLSAFFGGVDANFNNSGTISKTAGSGTARFLGLRINNTGAVAVSSGTLSLNSSGTHTGSFTATGATSNLDFTSGAHSCNAGVSFGGTGHFRLNGAILSLNVATPLGSGGSPSNFDFSSGSLNGGGSLNAFGALTWTGGTISTVVTLNTGGTVAISGNTDKNLSAGSFTNNGTATWSGTGRLAFSNGSLFNNAGTFNVITDGSVTVFFGGAASSFNNSGTLNRNGGTNNANFDGVPFNNTGTVTGSTGTTRFTAGGTHTGTFTATGTTTNLDFAGGTHNLNTNAKLGGTGHIRLTASNLNVNAAIPLGTSGTPGTFDLMGGTLGGGGSLTVTGGILWTAGTINTTAVLNTGGTVQMMGSTDKGLDAATFTNNGTATWSGSGRLAFSNGSIFNNAGTFNVTTDGSVTVFFGGAAASFNNSGTLNRSGGTNNANFDGLAFNNTGTVTGSSGTTRFTAGGTDTGAFTATGTGNLEFGGGTHNLNTNSTLGGTGHFRLTAGNLNLNAAIPLGANGSPSNFDFSSGTLGGGGSLNAFGIITWTGGTINTTVTLNTGGTLTLSGNTDKGLDAGVINNNGTANWSGTGRLAFSNGAIFNNPATFNVTTSGSVTVFFGGAVSSFNNSGTLNRSGGTGNANFDGVLFNNTGNVICSIGTTRFTAGGTHTGTFTATGTTTNLDFDGGTQTFNTNAKLGGTGHIRLLSGNLNINAAIPLGTSGTPGTFDLMGGTLGGGGSLTVTGNNTWTGGTINTTVTLNTGGTLTISGNTDKGLDAATYNNNGTATWSGTGRLAFSNGAVFNNAGTFNATTDGTVTVFFGGAASSFNNSGTLNRNGGTGTTSFGVTLNNTGSVNCSTGTTNFTAGGTHTGSFTATGATTNLDFSGGTDTFNTNASLGGTGHIRFNGATLTLGAAIPLGTDATPATLDFSNGTINGGGSLLAKGTLNWTGGTLSTIATVNAGGTLAISGSGDKNLDAGTLNNAGTATWTGSGRIGALNGSAFNNQAGGILNWQASGNFVNFGGAVSTLSNAGTINLGPPIRTFSLEGNYIQTTTGKLLFLIGGASPGTGYDQLTVNGNATLDGTIAGVLANNFEPNPLQHFTVMAYTAHTGAFASVAGVFTMQQSASSVDLVAFDIAHLQATLYAEQEVQNPPIQSNAVGTATADINPARTRVTVTLGTEGLSNVTAAHVHIGALGQNGPIAFSLYSPADGAFPSTLNKELTAANFIATQQAPTLSDAIAAYLSQGAYINIHTQANPNGEIRGQIVPVGVAAPTYGSISPSSGPFGSTVTIKGANFTDPIGVRLNHAQVPATRDSSSQITATVSNNASTGEFVILTPTGIAHGTDTYIVVPPPTITSFTPTQGVIGQVVTIDGTNLTNATTTKPTVQFNGTAVDPANVTVVSASQVQATVPAGATTGKITVQTTGGTVASASDFRVLFPPTISSFTPTTGPTGTLVTINGTNLTIAATPKSSVAFNGVLVDPANVTVISASQIQAIVPDTATTGKITVTTNDGTIDSAASYIVVPPPTVTGFTPTSGSVGMTITINGTNLTNATTAKPTVKFNGTTSGSVTVVSASQVKAVVPAGATTGPITVQTTGGPAASATSFTVVPKPTITSFTPTSGSVGMSVTINGTALTNATTAKPIVKFNTTLVATASVTVVSASQIKALVPAGATTGKITVETSGGPVLSAASFTVVPKPTLGSFTPASGSVGMSVTINGTALTNATTVKPTVKFNTTLVAAASVTVVSSTQIKALVPSGATTGKITVDTTGGSAATASNFTVVPKPTITSFTPVSGSVGMSITVNGTNFTNATTTKPTVKFNATLVSAANVTVVSASQIKALVPAGATTGKITVETTGGPALTGSSFTVVPKPTISSFTPTSGSVGMTVTINGTGLTNATTAKPTVKFNTTLVAAASITVVSSAQIRALVPSGATTGKITVTTTGGDALSAGTFTIVPKPTITSFTPTSGSVGMSITINGTSFTNVTTTKPTVKFNTTLVPAASVTVVSASQIKALVPSGATTGKITVTTTGGDALSAALFTVVAKPTITSFTPTSGSIGTTVTINGTALTNATTAKPTVKFGATVAGTVTVVSSSQIKAVVPSGAVTGLISVATTGGTVSSTSNFTVVPKPTLTSFTPASGSVGMEVTINGTNLTNATTTKPTVKFGATAAVTVTVVSASQVKAIVPSGAVTGLISVTTSGGTVNSASNFTVVAKPTISSFSPTSGKVGSTVTINGTALTNATTAKPTVKFNTTTATTVTVVSASQVTAVVPSGATTGHITVTTSGGSVVSAGTFTVSTSALQAGDGSSSTSSGSGDAPEASTLTLSGGSARAALGTVELYFTGPLDVDSAIDVAHYTVEVNGVAATLESAGYSGGKLTLGLATGSLKRGDTVVVRWNNLLDARGRVLNGSSGTLTAG